MEQRFRIVLRCGEAGVMVQAERVGTQFKCPGCDTPLEYEHKEMKLTSESKIPHEVRRVVELGKQ